MKKHSTVLTYMEGENYGVIYMQNSKNFAVINENGDIIKGGYFEVGKDAIDYAFDAYLKDK